MVESKILTSLGFTLTSLKRHPHLFIGSILGVLFADDSSDEEKLVRDEVAQLAFNYCNNAVRAGLSMGHDAMVVAVGGVYLAMNEKNCVSR